MRELAWRLRLLSAGAWNRLAGREPFRLLASSSRRRSLGRAVQEASTGPESRLLAKFTFPRSCSAPASHQHEASVLHCHETLIGAFAAAKSRTTVQGVWKGAERRVLAMLISIVPQHSVPLHRS